MPRKPSARTSARRSRASGEITEDAYYEEIADLLRTMPSDWRRQYRSGRDKLAATGGPMLPDTPSPEQAMLLIGITAGGNPSGDTPFGPHRVPRAVRDAAMKGIRLSHANNYGAWDFIGLARAIELVIVPSVSDTTFKRMGLYLFRHKKDALGTNFGNDATPSRGYMAWLNWGGDPAVPWTRAFERNPRRNPDMDLPPPPPDEGFWASEPDFTVSDETPTEAITAPALTVKSSGRLPSKALAVYFGDGYKYRIVLIDPKVLRRGKVEPRDVLGYVTAYHAANAQYASISEAAAEPGYGYLIYALMANYVAAAGAEGLEGSYSQTRFAKKFWAKQPGGVIKPLSRKEFRAQFGTTEQSIRDGGRLLVGMLAGKNASERQKDDIRHTLTNYLGTDYFGRYYRVSTNINNELAKSIPRPASPRASAEAISRVRVSLRNLALLPTEDGYLYLVTVPRGAADFGAANVLTRVLSFPRNYTSVMGTERYRQLPLYRDLQYILEATHVPDVLSATDQRVLARMLERGRALRDALVAGGVSESLQKELIPHLLEVSENYYSLNTPDPHMTLSFTTNPRRFPSSVRIFMPV
jgi:hypothetical protein